MHARSLRIRIPLLISAMLIVNLGILFASFRLYFVQDIVRQLEKSTGKHFNYQLLRSSRIVSSVMNFEIILLFIIVVIIGVIIHFSYAQPLTALCASVKNYKKKPVPRTKRRDEIGLLQNTFAEVTARLEEEKQIQTRMIASISHDIKTPLTSILGYSERLLSKEVTPERVTQYCRSSTRGAESASARRSRNSTAISRARSLASPTSAPSASGLSSKCSGRNTTASCAAAGSPSRL